MTLRRARPEPQVVFDDGKVVGYPGGGHRLGGYSPGQVIRKEKIAAIWGKDI